MAVGAALILRLLNLIAAAIFTITLVWLWRSVHEPTVDLGDVQVTMRFREVPQLVGADWRRRVVVRSGDTSTVTDLGIESGWWRGSALYRVGRSLILNDGQGGCILIFGKGPKPPVPCDGQPLSRDHRVRFLGVFTDRAPGGTPTFIDASEVDEPDLPPPL